MKTTILLLVFIINFNFQSVAQRNPTKDRDNTEDRIDRINDGNIDRNPDHEREKIQPPYREKLNPPELPDPPAPILIEIVEVPKPIKICSGPPPERPHYGSYLPKIMDKEIDLNELPLSEVLEIGIKNLDSELYNEAIKCFNILLKDDPLNYEVYTLRGRAYHGLELFERAKKDYSLGLKINKSYADGYYYLALTEISLEDIDEAIVDFEIAAELGNKKAEQLLKKYFR